MPLANAKKERYYIIVAYLNIEKCEMIHELYSSCQKFESNFFRAIFNNTAKS